MEDTGQQVGGVAKGSLTLVALMAVSSLMLYAFNVSMGWLLSPSDYGILGVSIAFLHILSFCVESGFPRTVAKFLAEREEQGKASIFKTSLMANLLLGVALSASFYVIANKLFNLGPAYDSITPLIAIIVIILSIGYVFRHALQGLFRLGRFGLTQNLRYLFQIVFAVVFIWLGWGVFGAFLGILIGASAILFFSVFFMRDFRFWQQTKWTAPLVYQFGIPMLLGTLFITLMINVDILGVKFFLGSTGISDELAGYYRSAVVVARIPIVVVGAMMAALFPYISRYSKFGQERAYINRGIKYAFVFLLPLCVVTVAIPEAMLGFFFPQSYLAGADALRILGIGSGFLVFIYVLAQSFQARGLPGVPARRLLPAFLLQLVLLYFLAPLFGITGAALATTLACFLGLLLLAANYIRRYEVHFKPEMGKVFVGFAILSGFLYLFPHSTKLLTLIDLALAAIIYLTSLALLKVLVERDIEILVSALPANKFVDRIGLGLKRIVIILNRAILK